MNIFQIAILIFMLSSLFIYISGNFENLIIGPDNLKVGDLVPFDIKAQKDIYFIDNAATEKQKEIEKRRSPAVFVRDDSNISSYFELLERDLNSRVLDKKTYQAIRDLLNDIYSTGLFDRNDALRAENRVVEFEKRIYDVRDLLTLDNVELYVAWKIGPNGDVGKIISSIAKYLSPNVKYDYALTIQRGEEAAERVLPVVVDYKSGDVIIAKDDILNPAQFELLKHIRINENTYTTLRIFLSLISASLTIIIAFMILSHLFYLSLRHDQYLNVIFFAEIVYFTVTFVLYFIDAHSVQVLHFNMHSFIYFPSIFSLNITNKKQSGYILLIANLVFVLLFPLSSVNYIAKSLAITYMSMNIFDTGGSRKDIAKRALLIIISSSLLTFLCDQLLYIPIDIMLFDVMVETLGVGICLVLVFIITPFIEDYYHFPTQYRLSLLANNMTPLLEQFRQKCPGSYEHCENVADLACDVADKIRLDRFFMRVAARYHDIGKIEHPEYFTENEKGNKKHDMINSKLSAKIIKSHLSHGVKILKESDIGIPEEIIKTISEHHGNDLISYFYYAATSEFKSTEINEADFRYDADPPSSRESAVLMLCDITEAAFRSRTDLSLNAEYDEIKAFISTLIDAKVSRGQLDESKITVGDIAKIKETLTISIIDKSHTRIKYPEAKSEQ